MVTFHKGHIRWSFVKRKCGNIVSGLSLLCHSHLKKLLLTFLLLFLALIVFAASISTLTDNFDDNSIAAEWSTSIGGGAINETNQELEISSLLLGGYSYLYSVNNYDLTGSQGTVKIVDAGNLSLSSWSTQFYLQKDASNYIKIYVSGTMIFCASYVASSYATIATTTWNATNMKYWRIREVSGTVYFDYSANGLFWTNLGSQTVANLFAVTSLQIILLAGTYASELSTTIAKLDDFNILPSGGAKFPTPDIWWHKRYE